MNDPSTEQRSTVAKTRWGILESSLSCSKGLSMPSRTRKWLKMLANFRKSSATAVDLRAVLRRWANFLHTQSNEQTQSCLRSLATHSPHWHQKVFLAGEAGGHKSKSGSLLFSLDWASAAAASVSSTVLYSALVVYVDSTKWLRIHYFPKQKKWELNCRQTTMKIATAFRSDH